MVDTEEKQWEVNILGHVNNLIHGILPIIDIYWGYSCQFSPFELTGIQYSDADTIIVSMQYFWDILY